MNNQMHILHYITLQPPLTARVSCLNSTTWSNNSTHSCVSITGSLAKKNNITVLAEGSHHQFNTSDTKQVCLYVKMFFVSHIWTLQPISKCRVFIHLLAGLQQRWYARQLYDTMNVLAVNLDQIPHSELRSIQTYFIGNKRMTSTQYTVHYVFNKDVFEIHPSFVRLLKQATQALCCPLAMRRYLWRH